MLKRFLRVCSMLLVVVMLANMLPTQALGEQFREALQSDSFTTNQTGTISPKEITVVGEITEKRSEYVKEYLLSDGTRMAAVYADPVHYEKDGQWEEIDNTLKTVGLGAAGTYETTAGIWQVSFPQQLSSAKQITITVVLSLKRG